MALLSPSKDNDECDTVLDKISKENGFINEVSHVCEAACSGIDR